MTDTSGQLTDHELEIESTDNANRPFIKMRGNLYWTGSAWAKLGAANLVPESYDYILLSYTGTDLTGVVYKTGGALGTTVATLTLTYTAGGDLETVTRT
jgi:hypothetical protein